MRRNERGVVFRLGRVVGDWSAPDGPGMKWVWWPIETMCRFNVFTGEENLLGAQGEWLGEFVPGTEGLVRIAGKQWRAIRDQEIPYGQNICVIGYDGLNLRVGLGNVLKSEQELLDEEIARNLKTLRLLDKKTDPRLRAMMRYRLGRLYERRGDLQVASEQYRLAEELDPNIRATFEKSVAKRD